jgi:Rho-related BTB domain-containing protein 1/2
MKHIICYQIPLPGVSRESFVALQDHLYSGQCPLLSHIDCIDLIALANRLCLPRLVALVEQYIVNELISAEDSGKSIYEDVLLFIEPAQVTLLSQLLNAAIVQHDEH